MANISLKASEHETEPTHYIACQHQQQARFTEGQTQTRSNCARLSGQPLLQVAQQFNDFLPMPFNSYLLYPLPLYPFQSPFNYRKRPHPPVFSRRAHTGQVRDLPSHSTLSGAFPLTGPGACCPRALTTGLGPASRPGKFNATASACSRVPIDGGGQFRNSPHQLPHSFIHLSMVSQGPRRWSLPKFTQSSWERKTQACNQISSLYCTPARKHRTRPQTYRFYIIYYQASIRLLTVVFSQTPSLPPNFYRLLHLNPVCVNLYNLVLVYFSFHGSLECHAQSIQYYSTVSIRSSSSNYIAVSSSGESSVFHLDDILSILCQVGLVVPVASL